jgi:hypothetical protein
VIRRKNKVNVHNNAIWYFRMLYVQVAKRIYETKNGAWKEREEEEIGKQFPMQNAPMPVNK